MPLSPYNHQWVVKHHHLDHVPIRYMLFGSVAAYLRNGVAS